MSSNTPANDEQPITRKEFRTFRRELTVVVLSLVAAITCVALVAFLG